MENSYRMQHQSSGNRCFRGGKMHTEKVIHAFTGVGYVKYMIRSIDPNTS